MTSKKPPMDIIVDLILAGRLIRADGPYEDHYPGRRDEFLVKVVEAIRRRAKETS